MVRRVWRRLATALAAIIFVLSIGACARQPAFPDSAGAYKGTALDGLAADFRLADQNGVEVALSDFRGQVVALSFMDSQCKEVCPLNVLVVPASTEQEELVHTPGVHLIDKMGQRRWYVSTPFDDAGTAQWTPPLSELLVKHIRELLSER
ncbi:MAG: SCO family protein [Chloroflexi bacterium]|nr:SCO family protein [Chloroflexota bacterium]